MLAIFVVILLACIAYIVVAALTHVFALALVAALLVLLAGFGNVPRWPVR